MNNFYFNAKDTIDMYKKLQTVFDEKSNEELVEIIQNANSSEYYIDEALTTLIKNNIGIIAKQSEAASHNIYVRPEDTPEDIINIGASLVRDAAYSFDSVKGYKFATYISKKIFGGVIDFLAKELFPEVSPKTAQKYCKAAKIYYDCLDEGITDEDIIVQTIMEKIGVKKYSTALKYMEEGLSKIGREVASITPTYLEEKCS